MIIVRLMGGLGNQMFQYAAARRLSLRHGVDVVFDGSCFDNCPEGDTPRQYQLGMLAITARFATPLEIAEISGLYRSIWQKLSVGMRRFTGIARYPTNLFREPSEHFCPDVLNLPDNVYLIGYWQSEKYFTDVANVIREELTIKAKPVGENRKLADQISNTESIAVHFRRGDYVTSVKTASYHGVVPLKYYYRALDYLQKKVKNPHLFVFSDDHQWVLDNVEFPVPAENVIHNPSELGCEDIRLMSLCKHNIIANSSFSWWGAWLNSNPGKIVIAPRRWISDSSVDLPDLIPTNWVRMDS
jgi:hypothetical protein